MKAHRIVDALLEWGGMASDWRGYWMDSGCKMHPVDDHLGWARRWLSANHPEELQAPEAQGTLGGRGLYAVMRKYGWFRIVVENKRIFVQPPKASRAQMAAVQEYAIEQGLVIVDEQTGRTIYDPRDDG